MTYKRIYDWKDLPPVPPDKAPETYALDFKVQHKSHPAEHAKDMAAFANAYGGVLLVGVSEKADNYERCLLSVVEAKQAAKDYEDAARDLLAPRPLVDPAVVLFPNDETKALVAINVDPFPGQLIGAKIPNSEGWRFPIRTATRHTTYLDPEKAMIYADPKTRKAAILLSALSEGTAIWVHVRSSHLSAPARMPGVWGSIHAETNTITLDLHKLVNPSSAEPSVAVHAPLEDARTVWVDEGRTAIRLAGTVHIIRAGPELPPVVFYSPE